MYLTYAKGKKSKPVTTKIFESKEREKYWKSEQKYSTSQKNNYQNSSDKSVPVSALNRKKLRMPKKQSLAKGMKTWLQDSEDTTASKAGCCSLL